MPETQAIVYPNPSEGLFYWKFTLSKSEDVKYQVIDNQGRVLISSKNLNFGSGEQVYPVDLASLPAGSYLFCWDTLEGANQKIRITITH